VVIEGAVQAGTTTSEPSPVAKSLALVAALTVNDVVPAGVVEAFVLMVKDADKLPMSVLAKRMVLVDASKQVF
jgi:hypothetical protein